MSDAHRRPLVTKTAWSVASNGVLAVGNVLATVVVARLLGPDGAGRTAYLVWAAATVALLVSFGLPACLQRYVAELHGRGDDGGALRLARTLVRRVVAIAMAVVVVGALATPLLSDDAALPAAFLALFATHAAAEAYRSWLLGAQRFDVATRVAVATVVVQIAGVAAGSALWGVPGAVLGYASGLLVPAAGAARVAALPVTAPPPPAETTARARRYARDTYLALVVSLAAWSQLEVVFLEPTWGDHGVAMFTTGLVLARLAAHGPTLLAGGLLPHLTERGAAGDPENVRRTYATAVRIAAALALPLCLGTAAIAPRLVPLVYGDEFVEAVPVAVLLCCTSAVGASASAGSALLYAMERSRFVLISGVCGAALAIAGFALVVPHAGALGAAATRGAVQLSMVAVGTWYIARRLRIPVPFRSVARTVAAALACAAGARACVAGLPAPWDLPVAVPVGAVVYVLAARALRTLEHDDARALASAVDLLPSRARAPFRRLVTFVAGSPA